MPPAPAKSFLVKRVMRSPIAGTSAWQKEIYLTNFPVCTSRVTKSDEIFRTCLATSAGHRPDWAIAIILMSLGRAVVLRAVLLTQKFQPGCSVWRTV